jgi:hypothetical protein
MQVVSRDEVSSKRRMNYAHNATLIWWRFYIGYSAKMRQSVA